MLLTFPGQPNWLAQLSSLFTVAKWTLAIPGMAVAAIALVAALVSLLAARRVPAQGGSGPAAR